MALIYPHVTAGQTAPPSAAAWNDVLRMLQWWKANVESAGGPRSARLPAPTDTILIRNDSGADRARYDCLAILTHELTDPDQWQRMLAADDPTSPVDQVAVLQEPIPDGKWGLAQVTGVCWATVALDSLWHDHAFPVRSAHVLGSGFFGPHRILWHPGSSGEQTCLLALQAPCPARYALTPAAGIDAGTEAGSGDSLTITPAYADCDLLYWDAENGYWEKTIDGSSPVQIRVYNPWDAIGASKRIKVSAGDDWLPTVDVELCDAT